MAMIMGMILVMGCFELGAAADAQSPSPNPQTGAAATAVSSLSSFFIASVAAILLC